MPYDAASKELLERDPLSWLIYAGLTPNGPVRVIDADLSTVTAEADKVFLVEAPEPWIAHFEIQSSRDISLPERILQYYVLLPLFS